MGVRGRRSAAALAVVSDNGLDLSKRPKPPADLSGIEVEEWTSIVNRMPADWFPRETHAMLAQYCRHVSASSRIADLIKATQAVIDREQKTKDEEKKSRVLFNSVKTLDRLFKMQDREGRAITSLATKMRISQQSLYDKSKKRGAPAKASEVQVTEVTSPWAWNKGDND